VGGFRNFGRLHLIQNRLIRPAYLPRVFGHLEPAFQRVPAALKGVSVKETPPLL